MGENNRPTGVTIIAILFILSAIPSLYGTVYVIVKGLGPALSDGLGSGLLENTWAYLLAIVATLFYGVFALVTGYGLWITKDWGRSLAIFMSVFLLFAFPVGTVAGVLIIWYLRKQEVRDAFPDSFSF